MGERQAFKLNFHVPCGRRTELRRSYLCRVSAEGLERRVQTFQLILLVLEVNVTKAPGGTDGFLSPRF